MLALQTKSITPSASSRKHAMENCDLVEKAPDANGWRLARATDGRLTVVKPDAVEAQENDAGKNDDPDTETLSGPSAARRIPVRVCRCFPWSEPGRYLSLRDKDNKEVAFIRDVANLDADSRRALKHSLTESAFILEITRIHSIEEEFEVRNWRVETRQGERSFQTARDAWPVDLPAGGLLIKDVAGDLHQIPNLQTLDAQSQKILWAYLD